MADDPDSELAFASGRYPKRKRREVTYRVGEPVVSDHSGFELESVQREKRKDGKAVTFKALPKKEIFPFLQLPAEVRNMVYRHGHCGVERASTLIMVKTARGYSQRSSDLIYGEPEEPMDIVFSLLLVSKQIYQEGCGILYNTEFIVADIRTLHEFMMNFSPTTAKQLQYLSIRCWDYGGGGKLSDHACFGILGRATNLKRLCLGVTYYGGNEEPQTVAAKLYQDAYIWFEAIAAARGKADAGVDLLQVDVGNFYLDDLDTISAEARRDEFLEALRKVVQQKILGKKGKKAKVAGSDEE